MENFEGQILNALRLEKQHLTDCNANVMVQLDALISRSTNRPFVTRLGDAERTVYRFGFGHMLNALDNVIALLEGSIGPAEDYSEPAAKRAELKTGQDLSMPVASE